MEGNLGRKFNTHKEIRDDKMVEFFEKNKEFKKTYILKPLKFVRKITGIEDSIKKQAIKEVKERGIIENVLTSNKPLTKTSTSMLINKINSLESSKSSSDLRKKVIEKLKSDQKKLKEQSMSISVLSPSRAMMSPSAKSSASSKKSSASSKKSSASSKKSSASSKKSSYEANEYLPVMRYKTSYI